MNSSFVHVEYPTEHPGVVRAERAAAALGRAARRVDGARGLASFLLAALVSALLVVADQVVSSWADDGHLLAAWITLWLIAFTTIGLFAPTMRRLANRTLEAGNAWSAARARRRADERLWALAQTDSRVMADLRAAQARSEAELPAVAAMAPADTAGAVASPALATLEAAADFDSTDWRRVAEMQLPSSRRYMLYL